MHKAVPPLALLAVLVTAGPALAGGEIHGTIETRRDGTLTGPIRWTGNENFWDDFIDASKDEVIVEREEGVNVKFLGWDLGEMGGNTTRYQSVFSIPVGHIARLEIDRSDIVQLTLKSGETYPVQATADFGSSVEVVIEDAERGPVELDWRDMVTVEFSGNDGPGRDAERLYGTMDTRHGPLTGYILWDKDEAVLDDVLDGEEDREDMEIAFRDIAVIEKASRRSSRVTLRSGKTHELRGTNDVNDDNRGIDLFIGGIGRVQVPWSEFERLTLADPPPSPRYESFDGGRRLSGTVTTHDGRTVTGEIRWDRDEEFTWETLDGDLGEIEYNILFENVHSVMPASRRSARVRLENGDLLVLEGGNDVGQDNKGIVVTPAEGDEETFRWHEVRQVVLCTRHPG